MSPESLAAPTTPAGPVDLPELGDGRFPVERNEGSAPTSSSPVVGQAAKKIAYTPLNNPRRTTLSESHASWTDETEPELTLDTPVAVEPSLNLESASFEKIIYLEGIPEHLGHHRECQTSQQSTHQHQHKEATYPPPPSDFDDYSLDSMLSSLDEAEELSLDESYYFTPIEEKPINRVSKVKVELQLRSELLEYLVKGQPPSYVEQLMREEATVQEWTLACAEQRDYERTQRRMERRRQRQSLQQEEQGNPVTGPLVNPSQERNFSGRRPTAQESVVPKSLVFGPSPTKPLSQQTTGASATPSNVPLSKNYSPSMASMEQLKDYDQHQKQPSLYSYWDFEKYHGIPAVLSLVLSCVAHVAMYELVLAVALRAMQPFLQYRLLFDGEDNILEATDGNIWVENVGYGVVLSVGLVISRMSGLLFSFSKRERETDEEESDSDDGDKNGKKRTRVTVLKNETPPFVTNFSERHLDPRRVDREWSQWMHYNKTGRCVKGIMDVIGFYLCFVAIMYFLGRFAPYLERR